MIRWRFVVTRCIVVIAILTLVAWGLGPVVRYATHTGLESMTGAKVELADAEVGLFPPWIRLQKLAIADPRDSKSMRNAVSAQAIELVIDGDALLHRRWVARRASIEGLMIGGRREHSGHFDYDIVDTEQNDDGESVLSRWIETAGGAMANQAKDYGKNLQTVRASEAIKARWTREYASLGDEAKQLEKQIRDIRDRVSLIRNPLREPQLLKPLRQEATAIQDRTREIRTKLAELPQQLQADLAALDQAKQADLRQLDQWVPIDLSDTENLGRELIQQTLRKQVAKIRGYMENLNTVAGVTVISPEAAARVRGKDYLLASDPSPQWLVRDCKVSGLLSQGGDDYALTGRIENLTPTPERLDEPTLARLRLEGPDVIIANLIADRRDGANVDVVKLHWPNLKSNAMQLGSDDKASIHLAGGHRELWVQITNDRGHINGRLICKQSGVKSELRTSPEMAKLAAIQTLSESIAKIDRIEIGADFSGTWDDFELRHQSNLGVALREATRTAIDAQVAQAKAKLAVEIDQAYAKQAEELRNWSSEQQNRADNLLAKADGSVEELFQKILGAFAPDGIYVGRVNDAIRGLLK